jgi:hypothetical protein
MNICALYIDHDPKWALKEYMLATLKQKIFTREEHKIH